MIAINFIGFLWALPVTLLGLVFLAPFYGLSDFAWDWNRWALTATAKRMAGNPGAQTIGSLLFVRKDRREAFNLKTLDRLWRHEDTHRKQAYVGGVLFALAYGIEFAIRFAFPGGDIEGQRRGQARWYRAYYRLSWERMARAAE